MITFTIDNIKPKHNYSLNEVCTVLSVSPKKLYMLRKEGTIRYYIRKADNAVRVCGSEIIKFYNS